MSVIRILRPSGRREWFLLLALTALILLLRWNSLEMPFERDEGEYAYSAWLLAHGGMPYSDSFMQKPPMVIYTYLVGEIIAPGSVVPPRVLAILAIGLSSLLLGLAVARHHGKIAGWTAAFLLPVLLSHPALVPFAANTELFMLPPILGVYYLASRSDSAWKSWFIAGACGAVAVLYKPVALAVLGWLFLYWLMTDWKASHNTAGSLRRLAAALAGAAVVMLPVLAPFLLHDGGRAMWECTVSFNELYIQVLSNQMTRSPLPQLSVNLLGAWWPALAAAVLLFLKPPARWYLPAGCTVAAVVTIARAPSGHYVIALVPFIAALAALGIDSLVRLLNDHGVPRARMAGVVLPVILTGALILPLVGQITLEPRELIPLCYGSNPFREAVTAGRVAGQETTGHDRVYIAGSEPEILYYAGRKSPTRFVIAYPMMLPTVMAEPYQVEAASALFSDPPALIVMVRSNLSWLRQRVQPSEHFLNALKNLVDSRYTLIGGVPAGTMEWHDTLDRQIGRTGSILIYRRNPLP